MSGGDATTGLTTIAPAPTSATPAIRSPLILRPPVPFLRQPEPSCRHSLLLAVAIVDVRSIVAEGGVFLVGGGDENKTIACTTAR
jgi:hypothetical protein